MKIVCISDTHNHTDITVPHGDVLIHAGDLTTTGTHRQLHHTLAWLESLPHKRKVVIAGNHDLMFENDPIPAREILSNYPSITYLQDEAIMIDGLKFYGSPWTPYFQGNPNYHWVFNFDHNDRFQGHPDAKRCWKAIPDDTDVLITHGPPMLTLDRVDYRNHVGDPILDTRTAYLSEMGQLKLHVFGHIHTDYGQQWIFDTLFVNAAICDEDYRPTNKPIVVNL